MSEFDSIIAEADERFNLNGKAEALLSALRVLITDETRGGLADFLEKFNQIGLSEAASSWVNAGANIEVSTGQIESALGTDTLHEITSQSATDYDTSMAAVAFMIPRLVDALTPDGVVPPGNNPAAETDDSETGSAASAAETFDRIGTAAAPALDKAKRNSGEINTSEENVSPTVDRAAGASTDKIDAGSDKTDSIYDVRSNSPLAWILPLLLLGLLLILGYWFCSKTPSPVNEQSSILIEQ